jgi:hypothetical protein
MFKKPLTLIDYFLRYLGGGRATGCDSSAPTPEAVKMNVETPTAIKEARLVVLVFIAVTEGASSRPAAPNFRR